MIENRLIWIRRRYMVRSEYTAKKCEHVLHRPSSDVRILRIQILVNQHRSMGGTQFSVLMLNRKTNTNTCHMPQAVCFTDWHQFVDIFFLAAVRSPWCVVRISHVPPLVRKTLDQHFNYARARAPLC